jgi:hypothetical protein
MAPKLPGKAGAGSGLHRLKVAKPRPFKAEEERKCGGKVGGEKSMKRLDRAPRKSGGRVGSENSPLSSASKTSSRPGGRLEA